MVVRLIIGIYKALRVSYYWEKALSAASKSEYDRALYFLSQSETIGPPTARHALLKGYLLYALQQNELSIETLQMARHLVEKSSRYTDDDKKYLNCYASLWSEAAAQELDNRTLTPFSPDYDNVSLSKVEKYLRLQFPLPDHPDWVQH